MSDRSNISLIKMDTFRFWCQKVLPLVYDESLSYYELLCKVVSYINDLIKNDQALQEFIEQWDANLDDIYKILDELQKEVDKYSSGELIPEYVEACKEYIDTNLEGLVGRIVKYVSFGITEDGHFCALVPKSWQFITFDTIVDPTSELYGHLILRW